MIHADYTRPMPQDPVSDSYKAKMRALGRLIRELREMRDWTQYELAERAGTTHDSVSRVERAYHSKASMWLVAKIAGAFDLRLADLLDEVDL